MNKQRFFHRTARALTIFLLTATSGAVLSKDITLYLDYRLYCDNPSWAPCKAMPHNVPGSTGWYVGGNFDTIEEAEAKAAADYRFLSGMTWNNGSTNWWQPQILEGQATYWTCVAPAYSSTMLKFYSTSTGWLKDLFWNHPCQWHYSNRTPSLIMNFSVLGSARIQVRTGTNLRCLERRLCANAKQVPQVPRQQDLWLRQNGG